MAGRPTILDEDMIKQIYKCIVIGMSIARACAYIGVDKQTFYKWKKFGIERPDSVYASLLENIERAESGGELKLISDIQRDASWQSKAWILERRYPDEWSRRETRKNVNVNFGYMPVELDEKDKIVFRDVEAIEDKKEPKKDITDE